MALTENRKPPDSKLPPNYTLVFDYDLAASVTIYKGAFVKLGTSGITPSTGTGRVLGYSIDEKKVNGTTAGAVQAKIAVGDLIVHAVTGVAGFGDVKKKVFASNDETLTLVSTSNGFAGWVYDHVSGTDAIVQMAGPAVPSA